MPGPPRDRASEELRRRLEAAEARAAELERQARVRAETDSPASFPPAVSERRPPAPPPSAVPASVPPAGWSDPRVIKAVLALVGAMTALGTPLGIWLTAKATAAESAQKRQAEVAKDATQTASSAKAESRDVAKELDALKQQLAAERAYNREVLRRMGVQLPKRQGDPDPPALDVTAPLRRPGTVTSGVVLEIKTPPP